MARSMHIRMAGGVWKEAGTQSGMMHGVWVLGEGNCLQPVWHLLCPHTARTFSHLLAGQHGERDLQPRLLKETWCDVIPHHIDLHGRDTM